MWLYIVGALLLAALGAQILAMRRFSARAASLARRVASGDVPAGGNPPARMRAFALAGGADVAEAFRAARFTQDAELQLSPARPFQPVPARQTVGVGTVGFVWFAETPGWAVPQMRVIDSYVDGQGLLAARVLGSIPVATVTGPVTSRAEAMRYLAELPWVPDAILGNPEIKWAERPDGWIEAALDLPEGRVAVRFRLDAAGDVVEMLADARPDLDKDGVEFSRVWRGVFRDYGRIGGRRIPRGGEVGYVTEGVFAPYWRGRITGYQMLR